MFNSSQKESKNCNRTYFIGAPFFKRKSKGNTMIPTVLNKKKLTTGQLQPVAIFNRVVFDTFSLGCSYSFIVT